MIFSFASRARALVFGLAFAGLAFTSMADAQQAAPLVVFQTVDSYAVIGSSQLEITGVISGQSAPERRTLHFFQLGPEACERAAILVLNRPGRLRLEVMGNLFGSTPNDITEATCRLVRVP